MRQIRVDFPRYFAAWLIMGTTILFVTVGVRSTLFAQPAQHPADIPTAQAAAAQCQQQLAAVRQEVKLCDQSVDFVYGPTQKQNAKAMVSLSNQLQEAQQQIQQLQQENTRLKQASASAPATPAPAPDPVVPTPEPPSKQES